jgi:diguanylate cyclase (GGDEF)-like protein
LEYIKIEVLKNYKKTILKTAILFFIIFSLFFIGAYATIEYNKFKIEKRILNLEGYYLIDKDNNKEWVFMYEHDKDKNFKENFNTELSRINEAEEGHFKTEKGIFEFSTLIPKGAKSNELQLNGKSYKIISYSPTDVNKKYYSESLIFLFLKSLSGKPYVFVIGAIVSIIIAVLTVINKASNDRIKFFAEIDTMTGALNRRAGINKLEEIFNKSKQYREKISICFIDINGLKDVNDTLGHNAGDELIKTSMDILKSSIRDIDFIIRLGGDEFLIVFPRTEAKGAEEIWDRAVIGFNRINSEDNREYLISISHGIAEYTPQAKNYLDELISEADKKMYDEKRDIKKKIKVIKGKQV